jgi:L-arabinokinase
MASACGGKDHFMSMECRPAELKPTVAVPPHMGFWGIDSGVAHSVGGTDGASEADYGSVRVGAFMGRAILAAQQPPLLRQGQCLSAMSPHQFDRDVIETGLLPECITGEAFLEKYGSHGDAVTTVEPGQTYAVRMPAQHPVFENERVKTFEQLLAAAPCDEQLGRLGELMFQSHVSYSRCQLGTAATDRIVALVQQAREAGQPVFGAKITGGGSGGTVCILARAGAEGDAAVREIARQYKATADCPRGHEPYIFCGSSIGAGDFGFLTVRLARLAA